MLENKSVEFLPLDSYELKLYGNGRVVALESTVKKGKSALRFKIDILDTRLNKQVDVEGDVKLLLYKPKGSSKLIPVRE